MLKNNIEEIRKLPVYDQSLSRKLLLKEIWKDKYAPFHDKIRKEETLLLVRRASQGDISARNILLERNIRFVYLVARRFDLFTKFHLFLYSDLFQEGMLRMVYVIENLHIHKDMNFLSYASVNLSAGIYNNMFKNNIGLYLPYTIKKNRISFVDYFEDKINFRSGANEEILGEERNLLPEESSDYSIDDELEFIDLCNTIESVLKTLTPRERDIVIYAFGLSGYPETSLEEIGDMFAVTRERARQILNKAIRRLKHSHRAEKLQPFLGIQVPPEERREVIVSRIREREESQRKRKYFKIEEHIYIGQRFSIKIDRAWYTMTVSEIFLGKRTFIAEIEKFYFSETLKFDFYEFEGMCEKGIVRRKF